MNYSRKSYYILFPYVLYCIFCECVSRTSETCKSLVLQDKCNIEIFLSLAQGQQLHIKVKNAVSVMTRPHLLEPLKTFI